MLFACEGRDHTTVERFRDDFETHGGRPEAVTEVTMDMSPAFIKGVEAQFPEATITFDKFHVVKQVNDAVGEVRRGERKQRPELAGTRYLWLRNPKGMSPHARATLANLRHRSLKTARAYAIKEALEGFWEQDEADAEPYLRHWYFWATHSRLEPVIRAAKTIKEHWDGILSYMRSHATNAILEGINSLVQAASARARGYRSIRNYITMIYLLAAKLDYRLPTLNGGKLAFAHTKQR